MDLPPLDLSALNTGVNSDAYGAMESLVDSMDGARRHRHSPATWGGAARLFWAGRTLEECPPASRLTRPARRPRSNPRGLAVCTR